MEEALDLSFDRLLMMMMMMMQTNLGTHATSCLFSIRVFFFQGCHIFNTELSLALMLLMAGAIPLLPQYAFMACIGKTSRLS